MATLKCLACGHDNDVGDESCASCSSFLNLKLCSACEAINANNAERCHSCKAQFRAEPEVVSFEMDPPPPGDLVEEPAPALPAVWRRAADRARTPRSKRAAALAVLPLVVAGLAYYFYAPSQAAKTSEPPPRVKSAEKLEPAPKANPEVAPSEPARQQAAEPRQASTPAVSGRIAASRSASAPSRSTPPPEPRRTGAWVTHTRAASVDTAGKPTGVEAQVKTTAAAVPASTNTAVTIPVLAAPAPASNAAIVPVSESAAAIADPTRGSITHTKADLNESAATATLPAAVTQARTAPAETKNDEPGACPPAVVALSLCKSR